jgi:hypothetical protein
MMERTYDRFFRKTVELKIEKRIVGSLTGLLQAMSVKDIVKGPKWKIHY